MPAITENILEETCLPWLAELGWSTLHGPNVAPKLQPVNEKITGKSFFGDDCVRH